MSWEITNRLKLCVKMCLPLYKKELKGILSKSTPWDPRNKSISRKLPLVWTKFCFFTQICPSYCRKECVHQTLRHFGEKRNKIWKFEEKCVPTEHTYII